MFKTKLRHLGAAVALTFTAASPQVLAGCDSCLKGAITATDKLINNGLKTTQQAVKANIQAVAALNAAITAYDATLSATFELNNNTLNASLVDAKNRVNLALDKSIKVDTELTNHFLQEFTKLMRQLMTAERSSEVERNFGANAHPISGAIGGNRAALLKQAFDQAEQLRKDLGVKMHEYTSQSPEALSISPEQYYQKHLAEEEGVWDITPLLTKTSLSAEESENMQKLLTILSNPVPTRELTAAEATLRPDAEAYELKRRANNTMLELTHSIMMQNVIDKHPLIEIAPENWQQGYATGEEVVDGKVSINQMLESETLGRLASSGWFLDMKTRTEAGLMREQVYQQAVRNYMLLREYEKSQQELWLLSILAKDELEQIKP